LFVPAPSRSDSTEVEHCINLPHIRFVVHNGAFDFDPGMSFEREGLGSNDQERGNATTLEEANGRGRSLQAEHLLPVKNTSKVDRSAKPLDGIGCGTSFPGGKLANFCVNPPKAAPREEPVEVEQL
jgi:hypothetical protein